MSKGAHAGQKKILDSPRTGVMGSCELSKCVLGIELMFSVKVVFSLNHGAISSALTACYFETGSPYIGQAVLKLKIF